MKVRQNRPENPPERRAEEQSGREHTTDRSRPNAGHNCKQLRAKKTNDEPKRRVLVENLINRAIPVPPHLWVTNRQHADYESTERQAHVNRRFQARKIFFAALQ